MSKNRKIFKILFPGIYIKSVTRLGLESSLKKIFTFNEQWGEVLDVGSKDGPYKNLLNFKDYKRLDVVESSNPDICCDLHDLKCKNNSFDTIIATEVYEHLYDPQQATREIFRVLRKGGRLILSTRFIYKYHPDPNDYYRFTNDSLKWLLRDFSDIKIIPHGNRLHVFWQIFINDSFLKVFLNFFNPVIVKINFKKSNFPCGFIVVAKK